jgi:RES domain-containing protein
MTLARQMNPWSGSAFRHIPAGSPYDVLDFRFAGRGADNRWNEPGSPTLYLAGDEGVLIAEWGRHFAMNRTAQLQEMTIERSAFSLELSIDFVIDLRDDKVCKALSLVNAPTCFQDIQIARATAQFVRRTTAGQAMLVPSMAFLDHPERWCLVIFLEKLPPDPRRYFSAVTPCGPLRWG